MKHKGLVIIFVILMVITVGCGTKDTTKVDDNSQNDQLVSNFEKTDGTASATKKAMQPLEFTTTPEKIATGTVSLTEIFDLLEIDLVGVPSSRSYKLPERYDDLPRIGMSMQPDMEILKSLDVDLFITDLTLKNSLEKSLRDKKINAEFIATSGYDEIIFSITSIGNAFGKEKKAQQVVGQMKAIEQEVMRKIKDKESKKVMIIFGTPESFMLATDLSYVGDLANRLKLNNVTDSMKVKSPYIPFSIESVLAMNPDTILRFTHTDPETSKKMFAEEFAENPVWEALDAVKDDQVFDLDPKYFGVVASIRCAEALKILSDIVYGN